MLLRLLFLFAAPACAQTFPKFTGLVTDAANVLPGDRRAALEGKLEALQQQTGNQLVVATVPSLQGDSVEDYANRLFRAWGVGLKGADNGVLLVVAPTEHKVRIEVGYRMEPVVTDALSSVIIQQKIVPAFKAGDIPGGIEAGADALADQLRQPNDVAQAKVKEAQAEYDRGHRATGAGGGGGVPLGLIFWGMIALFVLLSFLRRRAAGMFRLVERAKILEEDPVRRPVAEQVVERQHEQMPLRLGPQKNGTQQRPPLEIEFVDGSIGARADGGVKPRRARTTSPDQGSMF